MKKVIAILAVLVVLVGAVFAVDEPANDGQSQRITLKSVVARKDPDFAIKLGDVAGKIVTSNDGDHDGNQPATQVGDISQTDIQQTFKIVQTSVAKNRFTYTFTVSATKFVQVKNGSGQDVTTGAHEANSTITFESISTSATAYVAAHEEADPTDETQTIQIPESGTDGIGSVTPAAAANGVLTFALTYSGSAEVSTRDLAQFDIKWTSDRTAPAGEYLADVTMAIEAT